MSSDLKPTLSARAAAQLLGLDPRTVLRGLERGEIPGRKVGKRWVVSRAALEAWLNSNAKEAA